MSEKAQDVDFLRHDGGPNLPRGRPSVRELW
jgi:hypothetical protein